MKPSQIYLKAWIAAEDALPAESLALIRSYDELHRKWIKSWNTGEKILPIPDEVMLASERIEADALAKIAFDLRRQCNMVAHEEWKQEKDMEVSVNDGQFELMLAMNGSGE